MVKDYLLVHKSILPNCFDAVLQAKELIDSGKIKNVTDAIKAVGISRSTFYKYKDLIIKPSESLNGKTAVITMMLSNKAGRLSAVLSVISEAEANILTITQSLPVKGRASMTVSLDISSMTQSVSSLLEKIILIDGVTNPRIIAIE